jgi:thiol-disulfide isomerase/thioredoxin
MLDINDIKELNEFIYSNKNNIIMLYFGAIWCGPCKKLKDKLTDERELKELPDLAICYIDIDIEENKEIVDIYEVTNLPTIFFINLNENNEVEIIDNIIGYDWIGIKFAYDKINKKCL